MEAAHCRHCIADDALRYSDSSLTVASPPEWPLSSYSAILNARVFSVLICTLPALAKKNYFFKILCDSCLYLHNFVTKTDM